MIPQHHIIVEPIWAVTEKMWSIWRKKMQVYIEHRTCVYTILVNSTSMLNKEQIFPPNNLHIAWCKCSNFWFPFTCRDIIMSNAFVSFVAANLEIFRNKKCTENFPTRSWWSWCAWEISLQHTLLIIRHTPRKQKKNDKQQEMPTRTKRIATTAAVARS